MSPVAIESLPGPSEPSIISKIKTRKKIPQAIRSEIWRRDCGDSLNGNCFCCRNEIRYESFEAGHIQSVAMQGRDDISNLVVICGPCNRSMGKTNMKEYCAKYFPLRVYKWP